MKIIDRQGRLFGKVNILDLTIITLSAFIAITFIALVHKTTSADKVFKREPVVIKIRPRNLPEGLFDMIEIGDKSKNSDVGFYSEIIKKVEVGRKTEERYGDQQVIDVVLWIGLDAYVQEDGTIQFENTDIKPGSRFIFNSKNYRVEGKIIKVLRNADFEKSS